MKPTKNDLLVHFDPIDEKLVIYRLLSETSLTEKVIHTEYSLDDLRQKGLALAGSLIGEDILVSLEGTRDTLA